MKRYFIYLSYNGAGFCGWQTQPNGVSIQETIEKALTLILRTQTAIVGAGRTDAGVHARMMTAHFDTHIDFDSIILTDKLNRILPKGIAIEKVVEVANNAHARFDATSRLYRYYITTAKDPFLYPYKMKMYGDLDIIKMNACAKILFEYQDFTSFSKTHTDTKTNNCKIMIAWWERDGNDFVFTIKADRFLRNMVRSIVGTLIEAGRGKLDEQGLRHIIEAKDRRAAGVSVPANGLFLEMIEYERN